MQSKDVTATGIAAFTKGDGKSSTVQVSGAYTGLAFKMKGSVDGTSFFDVGCLDLSTGLWVPGGTVISPTDNATAAWRVPSENFDGIGPNVSAITTGKAVFAHEEGETGIDFVASTNVQVPSLPQTQFTAIATNTPCTLTGAQMAGANNVVVNLTAALAGAGTLNSPTAAQIVAAIPNAAVGQSYRLRIINSSSGNFAWTLTTATGITLTGTMSIAQNTFRDFNVTLTSLTAVTIQQVGTGATS